MEWSIDTYIRDNPDNLSREDLNKIYTLPEIRNQVFFPDYEQYGYIPREVRVKKTILNINIIDMCLISVSTNRLLTLGFTWNLEGKIENGNFDDYIYKFTAETGGDNSIHIDLLVKNRLQLDLSPDYRNTRNYTGSFQDKSIACFKAIKYNYDTYARDIISGENWDRNAWKDPRDD
jgi:hypothetical protein